MFHNLESRIWWIRLEGSRSVRRFPLPLGKRVRKQYCVRKPWEKIAGERVGASEVAHPAVAYYVHKILIPPV